MSRIITVCWSGLRFLCDSLLHKALRGVALGQAWATACGVCVCVCLCLCPTPKVTKKEQAKADMCALPQRQW